MALLVRANFVEDVRATVLRELSTTWGVVPPDEASASDVCLALFAILHRMIEPKPRRVHRSRELLARMPKLAPDHAAAFDEIARALTQGTDVNHRQSKQIFRIGRPDALLNEWGIHHLHLGAKIEGDGFINRTGPLLFLFVQGAVVYLLDVWTHADGFARDEMLHLIDRNWPRVLDRYELKGVSIDKNVDESTRKVFRGKGVTTLFARKNGTVIGPPGGGYVTTGLPLSARLETDALLGQAAEAERTCRVCIPQIYETTRIAKPSFAGHELHLRYEIVNDARRYVVREAQTDGLVPRHLCVPGRRWRW